MFIRSQCHRDFWHLALSPTLDSVSLNIMGVDGYEPCSHLAYVLLSNNPVGHFEAQFGERCNRAAPCIRCTLFLLWTN